MFPRTNSAFVLAQYFGYLRRNPDDAPDRNFNGYQFWLDKLNQFNGNFVQADMVKGVSRLPRISGTVWAGELRYQSMNFP